MKKKTLIVIILVFGALSVNTNEVFGNIIIDNGDSGTSSIGTWEVSGGLNPFGVDSLWSRDGSTYTWQFDSQPAGNYEVLLWWTEWESRSQSVPVEIEYDDGMTTIIINQQLNGHQWNSMGSYFFGGAGSVKMISQPNPSSTCADAVWFRYNNAPEPTTLLLLGLGGVLIRKHR